MSAISRNLLSASQQFLRAAQPAVLSPRAKMVVSTAMLALSVLSAVTAPTPAQAQSGYGANGSGYGANGAGYGANGGYGGNTDQSALPASSAGRWGEMLGGVMGKTVGVLVSGVPAASEIGRRMQEVSSGVGEEVGRNVGRTVAQKPYVASNSTMDGRSPHAISMALANMPAIERDYLDTLGVNAIFAYSAAASAQSGTPAYSSVMNTRESAVRDFELALRSVAERGFSIAPWAEVRTALQQPVRSVPEARFVQYGQVMTQRLHRPGGPGYVVPQSYLNAQQQNYVPPAQQQQRGYVSPAYNTSPAASPQGQYVQQVQQVQPVPRTNSLEAMRASMNGMLKPLTSVDRP